MDIRVPVADTPLENAHQLVPLFGLNVAGVKDSTLRTSMPAMSLSVFSVQ